ncbi:MAG: Hsp20/alpha crystallin family protein [Promethearchaeota archaeon]
MSIIRQNRYWPFGIIDSFFENFWEPMDFTTLSIPKVQFPKLDIKEEETHYEIMAELPGYNKDEVNIEIKDDLLTISTEHKEEKEEEQEGYIYMERLHKSFSRAFRIPKYIKSEDIKAKMENGLLTLTIPKKEPKSPKKVEIKSHEEIEDTKSVWKKLAEDTKPDKK